ncbi:MAG: hypothetical protein JSU63_10415 [Phycisphaerales bacterium]|nr:MAG: hypothetical protein JSU63_10415 [Phycisphaerales bacterium]
MWATIRFRRFALIGLAFFAAVGTVFGQLTPADIAALEEQGVREGWTFQVRENGATDWSLEELTGLVEPEEWWVDAPFDPCTPKRSLPGSFDWRDYGCCTPVRNQGGCGSCWAFATVGALEQNIIIQDNQSVDLSEQWLVSCNRDGWSCGGGWWAHDYHDWKTDTCGGRGSVFESDFPYTGTNASCNCPYPHDYLIDSWAYIGSSWEVAPTDAIKQAILYHGPVTVAVTANSAMQAYSGGIFNACSSSSVNHGVVIVGWDDNQGDVGVWIMRNSWGGWWGEGGYMRIPYGCSNIGYAANYVVYTGQAPMPPAVPPSPHNARKNRYISFVPNNEMDVAFRVEMTSGPGSTGVVGWVGEPEEIKDGVYVARVVDAPVYRFWAENVVHCGDCEVVPLAEYSIRATVDEVVFSEPFVVGTIERPGEKYYGDVVGPGLGVLPPEPGFLAPDGLVNVSDVQAFALTAEGLGSPSAHVTWVDVHGLGPGSPPNGILNVSDLQQILLGLAGAQFSDCPDHLAPADCP